MPSVTLHLRLAELILDHWKTSGGPAPFDPRHPHEAAAFRLGAMGPDIGYFPGGFRPISDLAHAVSPGELARALIHHSSSPRERAFSWGWVTHVLADVLVHPMVGCAVGELTHGSPGFFVAGDDDPVNHVRVEAGLDGLYARRHPELRTCEFSVPLGERSLGLVLAAYRDTYGVAPPPERLAEALTLAPRRMSQGLALASVAARAMPPGGGTGRRRTAFRRLRGFVGQQSVSLAFMLPEPPPLWLINAVRDMEENFVEIFLEELEGGGASIPDANLDTGRPWQAELDHGGFLRAAEYLRAQGAPPRGLPDRARGVA